MHMQSPVYAREPGPIGRRWPDNERHNPDCNVKKMRKRSKHKQAAAAAAAHEALPNKHKHKQAAAAAAATICNY